MLNPGSRLRRALLCRTAVSGWHATSRRDFELVLIRYAQDVQVEFDPDFAAVDHAGPFWGHQGMLERERTFQEEWKRFEAEPAMLLDLGNRVVVLGSVRLTGRASGLEFESEVAQVLTVRRGLVARDQIFMAWDKGLRAAGIDPSSIALPSLGIAGEGTHR
jgi:ketosteroid isomerase-like protein